jgi:hypothetical protein
MRYKQIYISPQFKQLLDFIKHYRQLRGPTSMRLIAEQLILAYAKQLVSGVPEQTWRVNMLTLINVCEEEHTAFFAQQKKKHDHIQAIARRYDH